MAPQLASERIILPTCRLNLYLPSVGKPMTSAQYSMGIIFLLGDCANLAQSLAAEYKPPKNITTSKPRKLLYSFLSKFAGLFQSAAVNEPDVPKKLLNLCEQFVMWGNDLVAAVEERSTKPDFDLGRYPCTHYPEFSTKYLVPPNLGHFPKFYKAPSSSQS
ncbi:hypothetical protein N656DRAFT_69274 [Canariomyces notabilis]|uniref:Uncharacterized protein n=1 Tax=Canariomyces notabilis TaxID=2074819 RepID=A0AAN6TNW1_9PEZI|nr:hypothetical protein N656DRAFT_69274 [Canariomyces arenarius]